MFCPNCGTQMPDEARFCPSCGSRMEPERAPVTAAVPAAEQTPPAARRDAYHEPAAQQTAGAYQQPAQEAACQPVYRDPDPQYPPHSPYPQPAPQPRKNRGLVIAVIVLAVLVVIGGCAYIAVSVLDLFGNVGGARGYSNYRDLLDDYFDAFEDSDADAFVKLILPEIMDSAEESDLTNQDVAYYLDSWYDDYGNEVDSWYISDETAYSMDDFSYLYSLDGEDVSVIDLTVEVQLDGPWNYDVEIFDFDLIQVDGKWYLIEVW
jgi:hypothetical protein